MMSGPEHRPSAGAPVTTQEGILERVTDVNEENAWDRGEASVPGETGLVTVVVHVLATFRWCGMIALWIRLVAANSRSFEPRLGSAFVHDCLIGECLRAEGVDREQVAEAQVPDGTSTGRLH
jgi:hypothetical protein